ncbi:MAG: hypothetical protein AB7L91_01980 [Dehalococcoidia bacterium]
MPATPDDARALADLDRRIRLLLPEDYQERYQDLQPVPMRSAGLVYGDDGRVAWDKIWGSFCDLALAGGPPHKGRLLEPGSPDVIAAAPDRYDEVVDEIRRGVWLAAALDARPAPTPGWVRVHTFGDAMAGWLLRAITMENVAVRGEGSTIDLPAGPDFRLEREIKSVVTVIAKTTHYWMGHMPSSQQRAIAALFAEQDAAGPLLRPGGGGAAPAADRLAALTTAVATGIRERTGLEHAAADAPAGWLGLACASVGEAIGLMRALVASHVLARREQTTLLVAIDPVADPDGARAVSAVSEVHRLCRAALST